MCIKVSHELVARTLRKFAVTAVSNPSNIYSSLAWQLGTKILRVHSEQIQKISQLVSTVVFTWILLMDYGLIEAMKITF